MHRRDFLGRTGVLTAGVFAGLESLARTSEMKFDSGTPWRDLFPRMETEVYLNAAGGTPLSTFAEEALLEYADYWKYGGTEGRSEVFRDTLSSIRSEFAHLIGAKEPEIALVSCTKEGEQIVLDSLDPWSGGGHVLTNVFHFAGSLHSYEGHRRNGRNVRIIRSDGWTLETDQMLDAIDHRTRLVCITLVSNVNGRIEDVRPIAEKAHEHGAFVYADVIQAAGIFPFNVKELGIDFAACSTYKWLYGPHGVGFLYVREDLQGAVLRDRLFPGHSRFRFPPWTPTADDGFSFTAPSDARRYEPGHHSYIGYACTLAGLRFLRETGIDTILEHSLDLTKQLRDLIDQDRYPCISPIDMASPIIAFENGEVDIVPALTEAGVVVSVTDRQFRVSPTLFNNKDDIALLADVVNSV